MNFQAAPWLWSSLGWGIMALASTVWAGGPSSPVEGMVECLRDFGTLADADALVTGWSREKTPVLIPMRPFKARSPGPSRFYFIYEKSPGRLEARQVELPLGVDAFVLKGVPGAFEHHFSDAVAKGQPGTSQWDYRSRVVGNATPSDAAEQILGAAAEWPASLREALWADLGRRLARLRTRLDLLRERRDGAAEKAGEARELVAVADRCGEWVNREVRRLGAKPVCTEGREPASTELLLPPMERSWCEFQRVVALRQEITGSNGALAQTRRPRMATEVEEPTAD